MVHLSPEMPVAETGAARNDEGLPLLVCWAIWLTASAALWMLALRAVAFAF